ncbi:MAG: hypothetical protein M1817_005993 [Caeruleum heppii]|nr:MAG: hypothetical protein M1817_005993 [Caeruleum heppii]
MGAEQIPLLAKEKMVDADADADVYPRRATWIGARKQRNGTQLPQAIAHRGYKAQHPENTICAFQGAIKAGAHAIETDLHLSKDGVVVLSHDADLKRCFGKEEKIINCDWKYLSTLRTLRAPHEPMPRLQELLEYLATPGLERIWLLLDIKIDNDIDDIMRLIAKTLAAVSPSRPWNERVVLGCWAGKYLRACHEHLPGFPVTYIGFSTAIARPFLEVPNVSFNMLQQVLMGPFGNAFMRDVKEAGRELFVWTVNEDRMMRWSIRKQVDVVITDDPKRFLEICKSYEEDAEPEELPWTMIMNLLRIHFFVLVFGFLFRWRHGLKIDGRWTTVRLEQG